MALVNVFLFIFLLLRRRAPRSTLFPYTTLFRSLARRVGPATDAQLLRPAVQCLRVRAAGEGAGHRAGGGLRPVGDRRWAAVPGALGRGLRVHVLRDERVAARWAVPRSTERRVGT